MNTYNTTDELARMEGGVWKRSYQDDRRGFYSRIPMLAYRRTEDDRLCFVVRQLGTRLAVEELVYE